MARPLIALLTDFGVRDHYVGVMKGVMLGICPDAQLVDLSHDVPPQDIGAAVRILAASVRYFPDGTLFLCVVDPGVGTTRPAVALDLDGQRFVGPDNGLFGDLWAAAHSRRGVALTSAAHARASTSRTFEGRDRFGPAAAWLAAGTPLEALGVPIDGVTPSPRIDAVHTGEEIRGVVVAVDRFGNLITNIPEGLLAQVPPPRAAFLGAHQAALIDGSYGDVADGGLCALIGSDGHLEVAVRNGSAAETLRAAAGAAVQVRSVA